MEFGVSQVENNGGSRKYLREAGLHENAKFLGLSYIANENWEGFDVEFETTDGQYFKERTFGPNIDKVYPKPIWKEGEQVGMETREQALERRVAEINKKLYYLAACFCSDEKELRASVKDVKTLKEFVEVLSSFINKQPQVSINFLAVWKNSDSKQKSNLILADRVKWCEAYQEGRRSGLRLTKWQQENQMIEKYPYVGDSSNIQSDDVIITEEASGLPF